MFPWCPRGPRAQGRAHGGRAQGRLGLSPRSGVHRRVETFSATGRPSLSGSLTTPRDSAPGRGLPSSDPCAWGSDSGELRVRVLWGGFKAECVSGATELVMKLHLPYQQTHFMRVVGKSGIFNTNLEAPVEIKVFLKIILFVPGCAGSSLL